MIKRDIGNNYLRIISNDFNKALKVGDFICRDITIIGTETDTSTIEEVELETINKEV